jgi:hypothetical protein
MGYVFYGRDSIPGRGKIFFFYSVASRPALSPTLPPIQWVQEVIPAGVRRTGREAGHSRPPSVGHSKQKSAYVHVYASYSERFPR